MKKFSENELLQIAGKTAYVLGKELEKSGCVAAVEITGIESRHQYALQITADVIDHKDVRGVFLRVHPQTGRPESYWCTCPDCSRRKQFCKHCAAVVLDYMHYENYYRNEFAEEYPPDIPPVQSGRYASTKKQEVERKTDPAFSGILQQFGKKEKLLAEPEPAIEPGSIHLEPTLHVKMYETTVSFRIGANKFYVVKDLAGLVRHVRRMEEYAYGKGLSFVHREEVFDEKGRSLLEFLRKRFDKNSYAYASTIRYLTLNSASVDELLELCGWDGIRIDFNGQEAMWKLTKEPAKRKLCITGKGKGAEINVDLPARHQTSAYNYYRKDGLLCRTDRRTQREIEEFEDYLYNLSGNSFYIAQEDLPLFFREMLPVLEKEYEVSVNNINPEDYLPVEAEFEFYLDLPQDNMITCDLVAVYGQNRYQVFKGIPQKGNRDVAKEYAMKNLVSRYCNAFDSGRALAVAADDDACMFGLLTEGLDCFRAEGKVFLSDRLKRITQVKRPNVTVGVSLSGNMLDLKLTSEGMSLEELSEILSKYDRKKKFYRMKNGSFLSLDDENLDTLAQVKKGLMLTDKQMAKGKVRVPKFRAMYLDAQLRESENIPVNKSRDFKALIRQMHTVEDSDYEVPQSLEKVLRGYQKTGYRWIETLCANGFGGILADDMGLGKTLQVIAFLLAHYESPQPDELRTLVICPASLVYNWENECRQFAPALPVLTVAGTAAERKALLASLPERAVLITSYDLLKRDIEEYQTIEFAFQIIDEAQFIKNANTKAAQAVKLVSSQFRMALTGTPVENRLSELWSIFDYLMPGYLYGYEKFRKEIENPIVSNNEEDAMRRLQKMVSPFLLRRLKKDVLKDLPDKIERNMVARMQGEQRKLYEAHVQRLQIFLGKQSKEEFEKSKIQILAELTKLRQLCCDPALLYEGYHSGSAKLDLCMDLVENAIESGHKILLFSQFTSMLERIAEQLAAKHISYYMLTGATPKKERARLVNAFNKNEVSVFCISLKAGGTGLNLTAADIVIHYDPWWNTAAQNQATDRTHRIGQKHVVNVYRLIASDSIEENIVKLQDRKKELADQVLGGSGAGSASFSKEELLELLSAWE